MFWVLQEPDPEVLARTELESLTWVKDLILLRFED